MSYGFAVAQSQRKRAEWERIFGSDRLPVLDVQPRRAEFRDGPVWVFDVAVGRLHEGQLNRLAAHLARRERVGYGEARARVQRHGLTIRAEGVVIEETKTADVWCDVGRFVFRLAMSYPRCLGERHERV